MSLDPWVGIRYNRGMKKPKKKPGKIGLLYFR